MKRYRQLAPTLFSLEPGSSSPISDQIADQVKRLVVSDQILAGDLLPSVRRMASHHSLNAMTVSRAYSAAESVGLLSRVAGIGMVVANSAWNGWCVANRLALLREGLKAVGLQATQLRLSAHVVLHEMLRWLGEPPAGSEPRALATSAISGQMTAWEPFDDGERWVHGAVLWLWHPGWREPRLAFASPDDDAMGDWVYANGTNVGAEGEAWPTHCCRPGVPMAPRYSGTSRPEGGSPKP